MRWLFTSDLHLTARARDDYRFGLFPWLAHQQKKQDSDATFILGDITHEKDNHPSHLVNKMVEGLKLLKPPVYILRGNHDCVDPENPFFKFLNEIEGIHFITDQAWLPDYAVYMVAHRSSENEFKEVCLLAPPICRVLLIHQTVDGAISESGAKLTGYKVPSRFGRVYAGDIHKPQTVTPTTYIGAPYHIRFGDAFDPRVLFVTESGEKNLTFPAPRKITLHVTDPSSIKKSEAIRGDMVKVVLDLPKEGVVDWSKYKKEILDVCRELGLENYGVDLNVAGTAPVKGTVKAAPGRTHKQTLIDFCKSEGLPELIQDIGLDLLK